MVDTSTFFALISIGGLLALGAAALGLAYAVERLRSPGPRGYDEAGARPRPVGRRMTASPSSTMAMPASRSGPNRSPNTSVAAAAPTSGTSSPKGATVAAG
jgi:hypothetical protein